MSLKYYIKYIIKWNIGNNSKININYCIFMILLTTNTYLIKMIKNKMYIHIFDGNGR